MDIQLPNTLPLSETEYISGIGDGDDLNVLPPTPKTISLSQSFTIYGEWLTEEIITAPKVIPFQYKIHYDGQRPIKDSRIGIPSTFTMYPRISFSIYMIAEFEHAGLTYRGESVFYDYSVRKDEGVVILEEDLSLLDTMDFYADGIKYDGSVLSYVENMTITMHPSNEDAIVSIDNDQIQAETQAETVITTTSIGSYSDGWTGWAISDIFFPSEDSLYIAEINSIHEDASVALSKTLGSTTISTEDPTQRFYVYSPFDYTYQSITGETPWYDGKTMQPNCYSNVAVPIFLGLDPSVEWDSIVVDIESSETLLYHWEYEQNSSLSPHTTTEPTNILWIHTEETESITKETPQLSNPFSVGPYTVTDEEAVEHVLIPQELLEQNELESTLFYCIPDSLAVYVQLGNPYIHAGNGYLPIHYKLKGDSFLPWYPKIHPGYFFKERTPYYAGSLKTEEHTVKNGEIRIQSMVESGTPVIVMHNEEYLQLSPFRNDMNEGSLVGTFRFEGQGESTIDVGFVPLPQSLSATYVDGEDIDISALTHSMITFDSPLKNKAIELSFILPNSFTIRHYNGQHFPAILFSDVADDEVVQVFYQPTDAEEYNSQSNTNPLYTQEVSPLIGVQLKESDGIVKSLKIQNTWNAPADGVSQGCIHVLCLDKHQNPIAGITPAAQISEGDILYVHPSDQYGFSVIGLRSSSTEGEALFQVSADTIVDSVPVFYHAAPLFGFFKPI